MFPTSRRSISLNFVSWSGSCALPQALPPPRSESGDRVVIGDWFQLLLPAGHAISHRRWSAQARLQGPPGDPYLPGRCGCRGRALGLFCDYLAARIAAGMVEDIRLSLFEHLQSLPLAYCNRTPSGAILARFSGDLVGLEGALVSLISWFVLPSLEVVYATVLMFWFSV